MVKKGLVTNLFIEEPIKIQPDCFRFVTDAQVHPRDVFENVAKDQRGRKGIGGDANNFGKLLPNLNTVTVDATRCRCNAI